MSDTADVAALRALASLAGIGVEWYDFAGRHKIVSPDVLRRLLTAMQLPCGTQGEIAVSRNLLESRPTLASLPPMLTTTIGRETVVLCDAVEALPARLELEDGSTRDVVLSADHGHLSIPAVDVPGYHSLLVGQREITLAVAPHHALRIDDLSPNPRLFGLAVQAYSLRRSGDGGIGDAAGLAVFAESAARHGADALSLSPLHSLFAAEPGRFGPYAPSSRLFLNPLHAAPALVLGEAAWARAGEVASLSETGAQLEALALIDWPAAAKAKLAQMRALFDAWDGGNDADQQDDFRRFQQDGGDLLRGHATFEALHAVQFCRGQPDWRAWDASLRDPASPAVAAFSAEHRREVEFHSFLQFLADRSLRLTQRRARDAGMRVGLIGDLAVGMDPIGSHAWSRQHDVLSGVAIGAPPDLFNQRGQDWGLTGFSPRALVQTGFAPFLATLRAVLRYAGGVRIDHAMGLTRLWLVPHGATSAEGAYLTYPADDMLRLLALESQRHAAIVIGEDLGTVPDGFREHWQAMGAQGMRVLWFECNANGFIPPEHWDRNSVAMTSTHDLPTVAGWWRGSDITTRDAAGCLGEAQDAFTLQAERQNDRSALWRAFVQAGTASGDQPSAEDTEPVVDAALDFVAQTSSPLCLLPLEDVLGLAEQPNLPGTIDQHPNWRRRLPGEAATILDTPKTAERLRHVAQRRGKPG